MKIGILTSGGDTPGMNAVITGIVLQGKKDGHKFIGYEEGWKGVLENQFIDDKKLSIYVNDDNFLYQGGTVLKTSRTNPLRRALGIETIKKNIQEENIDVLIAIGGDDTLGVAYELHKNGINIIGVPKTIDNDLSSTDYTFGFNTACNIAGEAIQRIHTTAKSHRRVFVVELMGRHTGWITLYAAIAGRAHLALIPEFPMSFEKIKEIIEKRFNKSGYCVVAVSEGYEIFDINENDIETDEFGHKHLKQLRIGDRLAERLAEETGLTTRAVTLGHVQRSGFPSAYDRILGYRFGVKAIQLVNSQRYGYMASLKGVDIKAVHLKDAVSELKYVDRDKWEAAKPLFDL